MKNIFKYIMMVAMTFIFGVNAFADEVAEYDPIHATLLPGSSELKFEENYGKNSAIILNGDYLKLKSKKGEPAKTNGVMLPVNALKDYTLELCFNISKLGMGSVAVGTQYYSVSFGKKGLVTVWCRPNETFNFPKWKMPKGNDKNQVIVKIINSKNTVSIFLNDKYVTEFKSQPEGPELLMMILCNCFLGQSEVELESIKIDQGPEID